MKIIKDEVRIKRNGKIGQWISLGALVVLGLGMYISFTQPELFTYSILALLVGFMLTQIGMYMGNRWGRSPRPDEQLDAALKGLPGDFSLYHYTTPAPHLLVGPAGVWVLLPFRQVGRVVYRKNRWRISGGGFIQTYMSIFGQEGMGRPDLEIEGSIASVKKVLAKNMEENDIPDIQGALVFTNPQVEIEENNAPMPAQPVKKLKDFMRQKAKDKPLSALKIKQVTEALEK